MGLCEISYGGPSNELLKANTIVFVYCDLVAPQFVADQKSPNTANNSLPVERRGTPFSKCLLSPCGKKSLSGYQYSDATNGRFDGPFRSRNITRKNGKFLARGINTRDVSFYRHYRSLTLLRGIIFTRLAVAVAAAGKVSDLSIRSHPSFSDATVWVVFWLGYFGRLDLSFSPAYTLLAKLWVGRH